MIKTIKSALLAACVLPWAIGCTPATPGESASSESAGEVITTASSVSDLGHEGTAVSYEDDWGAFKSAIANKNLDGINSFIVSGVSEAQNILDMMPPEALEALEKSAYKDLEKSDYNGTPVKAWEYQETGVDEEGNEIGMGLFFYFEEQPVGLRMIGLLAAG